MEVDMSDYVIGDVLLIEYKDRKQRLVAFLSKSLNETKRNYEIYNKEMLAIVSRLENLETPAKRHMFQVQDLDGS